MLRRLLRPFFYHIRVGIRADLSVPETNDAGRILFRQLRVMGDHDHQPVLRHLTQQVHDLHARVTVKGSGRFVRKQDIRVVHKCPGDRHPLHLSAGHLVRFLVKLLSQPHFLQRPDRTFPALRLIDPRDCQGKLYICQYSLMGDQVIALEYEPDGMVPVGIPVSVLILLCGDTVDDQVSAVVAVQTSDDIQKRCLSGPAGSQNGDELVIPEVQAHIVERLLDQFSGRILLTDMLDLKH